MRIKITAILLLIFGSAFAQIDYSQPIAFDFKDLFQITDFDLRSDYPAKQNILLVAAAKEEKFTSKLNGTYSFTINGYVEQLKFKEGVATIPVDFTNTSLFYIKHANKKGEEIQKLYYAKKNSNEVTFFYIPLWALLIIPLIIIVTIAIIRKLVVLGVLALFIGFLLINGLNISTITGMLKDAFAYFF